MTDNRYTGCVLQLQHLQHEETYYLVWIPFPKEHTGQQRNTFLDEAATATRNLLEHYDLGAIVQIYCPPRTEIFQISRQGTSPSDLSGAFHELLHTEIYPLLNKHFKEE